MVEVDTTASDVLADASATDVQATFCSTLVDQWVRLGVRHAVVAPGSRSTPMALALVARDEMRVHVVHDERVAAFVALGLGVDSPGGGGAVPALLLCTSGTATANFYPAVVEAGLSDVPMIVLTADRPEELRGVGAPQTIDQIELYGPHVRWFHDPGVPDAGSSSGWRRLATTAWSRSASGPVQLNLPFREPLVGTAQALPAPIEGALEFAPEMDDPAPVDTVPAGFGHTPGVILVGGRHGADVEQILELQTRTGWPLIADPTSGLRQVGTVSTVDALLRNERFATDYGADTIVRIGRPAASKVLAQWTARPDVTLIQVGGPGRIDPAGNVAAVCSLDGLLAAAPAAATDSDWLHAWHAADARAEQELRDHLTRAAPLTEPAVARLVAENLPSASQLTVSSSMPVRDLEWFGGRAASAHANRGANGIDGVVSTALGRALARPPGSGPSFVLVGDLAFVHDSNALVALTRRDVDLRVVIVDNDGGGIFSFLPQSSLLGHDRFEQLFGTPLGTDVLALASAHGVKTVEIAARDDLLAQLDRPGPWVCRVRSNRADNVLEHAALHDAVIAALDDLLAS